MTDSQKRVADAQAAYDKLADEVAKSVKSDKAFEKEILEEIKKKKKARGRTREEMIKQKGDAHRDLVQAKADRLKEVLQEVAAGKSSPPEAIAELVSLGHTPASADIEIRRVQGRPQSTTAPEPPRTVPTAPVPEREPAKPADPAAQVPVKGDDPISAAKDESETIVYREGADTEAAKVAAAAAKAK